MVAGIGALAVLAVGAFTVQAVVRAGGSGASSPEAAVERLAEAIAAEDPVAAAAALAPDEVATLGDLLAEVTDRAEDEGFAPEGDTFAGIDLTAEDLTYEVEPLAGDVARVHVVDGTLGYAFDPDDLSDRTRRLLPDEVEASSDEADISDEVDDVVDEDQAYLVTVRRGGGWFVSVAYTIAEQVVDGLDLAEADFDADVERRDPAPDPEAAVVALVEAIGQLDLRDVTAALPEDEWAVLVPYEEALTELLEGEAEDELAPDPDLEVTDIDVEVEEQGGGLAQVRVLGAEGTVEGSDGEVGWELDGWCLRSEVMEELVDDTCAAADDTYLGRALLPDDPTVVVVEERGGWVVSPVRTIFQGIRDVLPHLDHDVVVTLVGRPDLVEPAGEAPLGETFEVDLGDAGVATRTVTVPEDGEVIVTVDDETDAYLVDQDGDELERELEGYTVAAGRSYLLVLERQSRDGDAPVTVTLGRVVDEDLGEVSLSGTVEGVVSPAEPVRRVAFTVNREVTAEPVVDGDADVEVFEDGELACVEGERCSFAPGSDYLLVMRRGGLLGDDEVDVSVAFEVVAPPAPGSGSDATVDGDTVATGTLEDDLDVAFHDIVVPDGVSVVVTVAADDPDEDVDVELDGESYAVDGDEVLVVDGPLEATMEVYLFTAGPATYTITVEPA
ncbi:hypothetical protein HC251_03920 [Iamia sp. SCSIO 61187]|uniref:hypothetical protein n=1 Tax=Iamia sp. SCSIO 61187 TaxID=2722752 RepID=UPI001C628DF4|nr:hypothetical protein [Iamia sp. SCSIO 61187]QYG91670.1 hypothetical protein HC251_03920 [Iamia sp. SCSIO 61187]